jgi:hypothetical protein
MAANIENLQSGIEARQQELQHVADILAKNANTLPRRGMVSKVLLVLLGALVATRGTANQVLGISNNGTAMVYALLGTTVAVVAGLEAAFKWEARGADMTTLAARCQAATRSVDSRWIRQVNSAADAEKMAGALDLIEMQDARLAEVQERAAALGVNITAGVRERYAESASRGGEPQQGAPGLPRIAAN